MGKMNWIFISGIRSRDICDVSAQLYRKGKKEKKGGFSKGCFEPEGSHIHFTRPGQLTKNISNLIFRNNNLIVHM